MTTTGAAPRQPTDDGGSRQGGREASLSNGLIPAIYLVLPPLSSSFSGIASAVRGFCSCVQGSEAERGKAHIWREGEGAVKNRSPAMALRTSLVSPMTEPRRLSPHYPGSSEVSSEDEADDGANCLGFPRRPPPISPLLHATAGRDSKVRLSPPNILPYLPLSPFLLPSLRFSPSPRTCLCLPYHLLLHSFVSLALSAHGFMASPATSRFLRAPPHCRFTPRRGLPVPLLSSRPPLPRDPLGALSPSAPYSQAPDSRWDQPPFQPRPPS